MAVIQMNTRIDSSLKARGDATLERFGKSATDAVRGLWKYLAEEQTLPDFLMDEALLRKNSTASTKVKEGAGLVLHMAQELGLETPPASATYKELRDEAFARKYAKYQVD